MKIKTLLVALVAIVLAGFFAVSCKKAADKLTTLLLEDTTWEYTNPANDFFSLHFTSSKNCTMTVTFREHPDVPVSSEGTYTVDGLKVHIDWEEDGPDFDNFELIANDLVYRYEEDYIVFKKKK